MIKSRFLNTLGWRNCASGIIYLSLARQQVKLKGRNDFAPPPAPFHLINEIRPTGDVKLVGTSGEYTHGPCPY